MSRKIILSIVVIAIIAIGGTIFYNINSKSNESESTVWVVPNVLEPYIRIQKNEEMSSTDLTLNGSNKEMYYYFDILNYNEETDEYSKLELIPYVSMNVKNENEVENLVNINLYYINDISLGFVPENLEEITTKGEEGSNFEDYFECKKLNKYKEDDESNNIAHYVAKISLNTENQEYIDLIDNVSQRFELTLGYKQYEGK